MNIFGKKYILLIVLGIILILSFLAITLYEYISGNWRMGTLPFHSIVCINALKMLLPGLILIVAGIVWKNKMNK